MNSDTTTESNTRDPDDEDHRSVKPIREHIRHLERVHWINLQIQNGKYPNTRTVAEHFEVSQKTAQRTIEYMRDRLRLPLEYSREQRGYYYSEPTIGLCAIELTEGDLLMILLAGKMIEQYRGTALGKKLAGVFEKVFSAMTDTVSVDVGILAEAFSFETSHVSEPNHELLLRLGCAIKSRTRIEIEYYATSRNEVTTRTVDPIHLRNYLGEWYLIAFDHLRNDLRVFHAARVRSLAETQEAFEQPAGFELKKYLEEGFGMIFGHEPVEVEIDKRAIVRVTDGRH